MKKTRVNSFRFRIFTTKKTPFSFFLFVFFLLYKTKKPSLFLSARDFGLGQQFVGLDLPCKVTPLPSCQLKCLHLASKKAAEKKTCRKGEACWPIFFRKVRLEGWEGSWNHVGFSIGDFHELNIFPNSKPGKNSILMKISLCYWGLIETPRYAEGVDVAKVPAGVLSSVCSEAGALEVVLGRTAQPQNFWDFLVPEILRWHIKISLADIIYKI